MSNELIVVLPAPGSSTPELKELLEYLERHYDLRFHFGVEGNVNAGWKDGMPVSISHDIAIAVPRCHVERWWKFSLHALGIDGTLLEGDKITLQEGRIFIERNPSITA